MSGDLLSVDRVADMLGLHVRTVRNYVRAGRLKAVRVGKQYRISRADLAAFTGHVASPAADSAQRRVAVSSIVDIDDVDADTASRLTAALTGAAQGRQGAGGEDPLRLDVIHDPDRSRMKLVITGSTATTAHVLGLVALVLGN